MNRPARYTGTLLLLTLCVAISQAQPAQPPPTAKAIRQYFAYVNGKILDMAKDFPEDKYGYRPTKEMRSFGELIVHIASGNVYAAKAGKGEPAKWDELDPAKYPNKAAIVGLMEKSFQDSNEVLKSEPDEQFGKTLKPWLAVIEHSAEHYGLLVAYFRLNGLVPPETRKEQTQ